MTKNKAFFYREFTCPICRLDFKSRAVRSSAAIVQERESDFHVTYQKISPLHYSIMVCPQCCYAGSATAFKEKLRPETTNQLAYALKACGRKNRILANYVISKPLYGLFSWLFKPPSLKRPPIIIWPGCCWEPAGWLERRIFRNWKWRT